MNFDDYDDDDDCLNGEGESPATVGQSAGLAAGGHAATADGVIKKTISSIMYMYTCVCNHQQSGLHYFSSIKKRKHGSHAMNRKWNSLFDLFILH